MKKRAYTKKKQQTRCIQEGRSYHISGHPIYSTPVSIIIKRKRSIFQLFNEHLLERRKPTFSQI